MHTLYPFVTGPLAWLAFAILIGGFIYQLVRLWFLAKNRDPEVLRYMNLHYSLRSIMAWSIPYLAKSWQKNPVVTGVTFAFHICLLAVPIFAGAHVLLWDQFWDVRYWRLPAAATDVMTVVVILACLFFAFRRWRDPVVSYVSSLQDWIVLILVFLPFATGFLAYHQIFHYPTMLIAHIVSGEVLLAALPFTRLAHALYAFLMRGYIGSEFGGVRRAHDW